MKIENWHKNLTSKIILNQWNYTQLIIRFFLTQWFYDLMILWCETFKLDSFQIQLYLDCNMDHIHGPHVRDLHVHNTDHIHDLHVPKMENLIINSFLLPLESNWNLRWNDLRSFLTNKLYKNSIIGGNFSRNTYTVVPMPMMIIILWTKTNLNIS